MAGVKGRSGRKPMPKERAYLEAVKRGAPPDEVTKAVAAVIARAQRLGDPKALSAVLAVLVPTLSRSDIDAITHVKVETKRVTPDADNSAGFVPGAG